MKNNSRIGLILSLVIHGAIFAAIGVAIKNADPINYVEEETTSISMEMMTARLEQQQVAVKAENVQPEPKPEEVVKEVVVPKEIVSIPKKVEPIKKKEVKKEKPKEEPKKKPKKHKPRRVKHKPVKAKEVGKKARNGAFEKVKFTQGKQNQVGKKDGNKNGHSMQTGKVSSGVINAYKARLQRALQRQVNRSYPTREKRMRKQGAVVIAFTVNSSGKLVNIRVVKSSGNKNFDKAALKAAGRTKMNSGPPNGRLDITAVTIRFSLQQ